MNKLQIANRRKVVSATLGSVRAEGLNPTKSTKKKLQDYAEGKITAQQLRVATLQSITGKSRIIKK